MRQVRPDCTTVISQVKGGGIVRIAGEYVRYIDRLEAKVSPDSPIWSRIGIGMSGQAVSPCRQTGGSRCPGTLLRETHLDSGFRRKDETVTGTPPDCEGFEAADSPIWSRIGIGTSGQVISNQRCTRDSSVLVPHWAPAARAATSAVAQRAEGPLYDLRQRWVHVDRLRYRVGSQAQAHRVGHFLYQD